MSSYVGLYTDANLFFINLFTRLAPRRLVPPVAFITAVIVYLLVARPRRGMRENIRTVTGRRNVEALVLGTYYKFARNWTDIMLMSRLRGDALFRLIGRRSSSAPLDEALAAGKGAILVSPHLGNWELGGLGLAEMGYRLNVMTFPEPDEKVNAARERVRQERGIGFIYVDPKDTSPLAVIESVNALRRNEIVVLLGERDGSSNTVTVDFFGKQTAIPAGAAHLALVTGAPIIPVFVPMEGSRYATLMDEPIYVQGRRGENAGAIVEGTQRLVRVFEKYIRQYPDQWYNFFDYWGNGAKM